MIWVIMTASLWFYVLSYVRIAEGNELETENAKEQHCASTANADIVKSNVIEGNNNNHDDNL